MLKSWRWGGCVVGGWRLAHKILETTQSPNSPFPFWICLFGFGAWTLDWDLDSGLSIYLNLNVPDLNEIV